MTGWSGRVTEEVRSVMAKKKKAAKKKKK